MTLLEGLRDKIGSVDIELRSEDGGGNGSNGVQEERPAEDLDETEARAIELSDRFDLSSDREVHPDTVARVLAEIDGHTRIKRSIVKRTGLSDWTVGQALTILRDKDLAEVTGRFDDGTPGVGPYRFTATIDSREAASEEGSEEVSAEEALVDLVTLVEDIVPLDRLTDDELEIVERARGALNREW